LSVGFGDAPIGSRAASSATPRISWARRDASDDLGQSVRSGRLQPIDTTRAPYRFFFRRIAYRCKCDQPGSDAASGVERDVQAIVSELAEIKNQDVGPTPKDRLGRE